ncbi:MAG: hypothetical protein M1834_004241 [Cirrosporium novae-zelandiae]|nr:MAG: hypothetical protein M1834_004241 [Cirrosporium novae-zelandiae]
MSATIFAIPQDQISLARSTTEHLSGSFKPPPLAENERAYVTAFASLYTLQCEESATLSSRFESGIRYDYPNPKVDRPPLDAELLISETAAGVSPPKCQQAIVGDTKSFRVVIKIEKIVTRRFMPGGEGVEKATWE